MLQDQFSGVSSTLHGDIEQLALCSWNFAKYVIATVLFAWRLADTDANAHKILRLQMLGDRAQAVVAGQPTTNFDAVSYTHLTLPTIYSV